MKCICASVKLHNKAAARLTYVTAMPFCQMWDASRARAGHIQKACRTCLEHMQDESGTHANVTLELSCTVRSAQRHLLRLSDFSFMLLLILDQIYN